MRKVNGFLSVVLVLCMLFSFSACDNGGDSETAGGDDIVMSFGDFTLNESEYMYIASYIKDAVVYNQQVYIYQYTGTVYSETEILAMPVDDDTTVADYIRDYTIEFAQQLLIMEKLCADAGIEITDQEDIDAINEYVADIEYAYGGTDLFEIALARLGFSRSGIERFQKFYVYYDLLYNYRYGDTGITRVPTETVNKYFLENYLRYDGAMYSYYDSESGEDIVFEYTDNEISEYFADNYVKVCHILYMTVDKNNKELSETEKAEKKAKAEAALAKIQSGEKTLEDLKSETEDNGFEYIFTYGEMVEAFEEASFEMEVGDVRLVESEYGYHIIEKFEKTEEDLFGTVGEDGKTKGGMKDEVTAAMSADVINAEALDVLEKLNNGSLEKYPETDDEKPYYSVMEPQFINVNDTTYQTLIDIIKELESGVYTSKEFAGDATYILRTLDFTEEDMTSSIYDTIEAELASTLFAEYTQSYYDSIALNNELLEKFDVLTLPLLEEEFYVE